jgi:DNA-binding transcriptional ArsR family regulator
MAGPGRGELGAQPGRLPINLLSLPFHKSIAELERRLIEKANKDSAGNKSGAANRLQINRRLLYNNMEEHRAPPKYTLTRICPVGYIKSMESVFDIIAEPNRRAILNLLVASQQSVGEIERQLRMAQPTVSKHLRVLREAGFVESTVDAQRRLYRLKPEPFQELDAWLARFRRFWSEHVDALERHLDHMDPSTTMAAATKKTSRRRRGPHRERDSRSRDHDCS